MLYFSIHRYEYGKYWPWLRESDYDYIGEGEGIGYNINVPLNQVSLSRSTCLSFVNNPFYSDGEIFPPEH